jgi:acyl-CoA dehydrogenase
MQLIDRSILDLPLYEQRHHDLVMRLEAWAEEHQDLPLRHASSTPAQRCAEYTKLLGKAGWLAYVAGPSGTPGGRPDLRSLCLLREGFAQIDDLLDFSFSIQGLALSPIDWFGSPAQRETYRSAGLAGERIGALALSEPECGSDLSGLGFSAAATTDGYLLNGVKTWISNADIADFYCVLARTGEGPGGLGLSFLAVPAHAPNIRVERDCEMIAPRSIATLRFDGSTVSRDALIGEAGMGLKYAMDILAFYRVSVAAAALGMSRRAFSAATLWSRKRDIGGAKLSRNPITMCKLADMTIQNDAAALLVARAAWDFDMGKPGAATHASIAKVFATDGSQKVVDEAVQIFGAAGLVSGSVPERLYRQIRSLRIYEGTSEIQKLTVAAAIAKRAMPQVGN